MTSAGPYVQRQVAENQEHTCMYAPLYHHGTHQTSLINHSTLSPGEDSLILYPVLNHYVSAGIGR